jgi:hypothetical protein
MALCIVGLRRARAGFAAMGKSGILAASSTRIAWVVSLFVTLAGLGAILRARTHHRALGGVVYSVVAAVLAVGLLVVSARLVAVARKLPALALWGLGGAAAALLGFMGAMWKAQLAQSAFPPIPDVEIARLLDGSAFALAAFIASSGLLRARRSVTLLGPPVTIMVVLLGVSSVRSCVSLMQTLEAHAPGFAWLLSWIPTH